MSDRDFRDRFLIGHNRDSHTHSLTRDDCLRFQPKHFVAVTLYDRSSNDCMTSLTQPVFNWSQSVVIVRLVRDHRIKVGGRVVVIADKSG